MEGTDTVKMGKGDRALSDCAILGPRARREYGSLGGTADGSETFTAVTYKPEDTPPQARRLRGRDLARFMMMARDAWPSSEQPYILKERADIVIRR